MPGSLVAASTQRRVHQHTHTHTHTHMHTSSRAPWCPFAQKRGITWRAASCIRKCCSLSEEGSPLAVHRDATLSRRGEEHVTCEEGVSVITLLDRGDPSAPRLARVWARVQQYKGG